MFPSPPDEHRLSVLLNEEIALIDQNETADWSGGAIGRPFSVAIVSSPRAEGAPRVIISGLISARVQMSEIHLDLCHFQDGFTPAETSQSFRSPPLLRQRRLSRASSGFNLVLTPSPSPPLLPLCVR